MARRRRRRSTYRRVSTKGLPVGTGARFRKMTRSGMSPALAAWIGRRKYGRKKFASMSARGRRRRR